MARHRERVAAVEGHALDERPDELRGLGAKRVELRVLGHVRACAERDELAERRLVELGRRGVVRAVLAQEAR